MKGVNKIVVEIRPECEYFEKALLFIRPEKRDVPQKTISDNADKLLSDISIVKNNKESNKKYPVLLVIAGIITGSAVTSLIAFLSGLLYLSMGDLEVKSGKPVEIKVGKMWNDEFNLKLLIIILNEVLIFN